MKAIRRFTVRTVLPEPLAALDELAANLRWSWHEPTRHLFAHIAPELWAETEHDPIGLLGEVPPARLDELAADEAFVATANGLRDDLHSYLSEPRWYQGLDGEAPARSRYFSPEFGIAAALPQYSGGLGILAGDHLKSASTSACRSSASASSTAPATSARRSRARAGSRRATRYSIRMACRWACCATPTARPLVELALPGGGP